MKCKNVFQSVVSYSSHTMLQKSCYMCNKPILMAQWLAGAQSSFTSQKKEKNSKCLLQTVDPNPSKGALDWELFSWGLVNNYARLWSIFEWKPQCKVQIVCRQSTALFSLMSNTFLRDKLRLWLQFSRYCKKALKLIFKQFLLKLIYSFIGAKRTIMTK